MEANSSSYPEVPAHEDYPPFEERFGDQTSPPPVTVPYTRPIPPPKKHNVWPVILLSMLLVALIAANIVLLMINARNQNNSPTPTPTPTPTLTPTIPFNSELTDNTTPSGTLTVTPPGSVSPSAAEFPGRLQVTSPLAGSNLAAAGGTLQLTGQMQGFFEGVLSFKLVNTDGMVLYKNSITVANNYGTFAPFSKSFTIPAIPVANRTTIINLVFYEISEKDGSEADLVTIGLLLN